METPNEQTQIAQFLVDVFAHLDRTVEFTHRPMSPENRWLSKDAPIVQVIFPEDVISLRPIDANFVTAYGFNEVHSRDNFVNAAVAVLQTLKEADIPESILRYVDALVESYSGPEPAIKEIPAEDPTPQRTFETEETKDGWQ